MEIVELTNTFLPRLISLYVDDVLPFHALLDVDLWKKLFPDMPATSPTQIRWNQISFTCHPLQDDTLLFTFILPEPLFKGESKFAAFRIDLQNQDSRQATYYLLNKPAHYDDQWDVLDLTFPANGKLEPKFCCKLDGAATLRNFVLCVQQNALDKPAQKSSFGNWVKSLFSTNNNPNQAAI